MALTQVFRSTHTGSLYLQGQNGKLQAVLDAILVNGYNPQTITITRTGTVATATCTAHGFVAEQVLAISGADQADYNLTLTRITNVTANTFDFTVANSPATPATGTITAKVASLGWSIAYTSGDDRSYQRPAGSNGWYLNVSNGATGQSARTRLFETVTAAGVTATNGTNPVPSEATQSGGAYHWLSTAVNTTDRNWVAWGNESTLYLCIDSSGATFGSPLFVTDLVGPNALTNHIILSGSSSSGYTTTSTPDTVYGSASYTASFTYCTANRAGTTSSNKASLFACGSGSALGAPSTGAEDYATWGMTISRVRIQTMDDGLWAYLPGLFAPWTDSTTPTTADTLSGATGSDWAGFNFEIFSKTSSFRVLVQTDDDWAL